MATAAEPRSRTMIPEQRVVLRDVGWEGYETILALVGDGPTRLTYDRGDLELMSPSPDHDILKTLFGRLIETLTLELDLPCLGIGSTTWRRRLKERGLEPDEAYYLANAGRVVGKRLDPNVDPPPDLAIEIEISRSALDRMSVYAELGIPEVWRFDGETLHIAQLQADGTYADAAFSPSFPFLPPAEVVRWVLLGEGVDQTPWIRQFRDWVRDESAPRLQGH